MRLAERTTKMARQDATLWGSVRFPNREMLEFGIRALNEFLTTNCADPLDPGEPSDQIEIREEAGSLRLLLNVDCQVYDFDRSGVDALENAMKTLVAEPAYMVLDNLDTGDAEMRRTAIYLGDRSEARIRFALSELGDLVSLSDEQRERIADVLRGGVGDNAAERLTLPARSFRVRKTDYRACAEFLQGQPSGAILSVTYAGCFDSGASEPVQSEGTSGDVPESVLACFERIAERVIDHKRYEMIEDSLGAKLVVAMTADGLVASLSKMREVMDLTEVVRIEPGTQQ